MPFIFDDIAVASITAEAATAATGVAPIEAATAATSVTPIEAATSATIATPIEATTATAGSTVAMEATTALDAVTEGSSIVEITTIEGDLICPGTESTIDLSDVAFVDEFPISESSDIPTEIGGLDRNVFYDEFSSEIPSDSNSVMETIPEGSQDIITPKSYEELCETRDCGGRYNDLKNEGWGWNDNPPHEVHHMPADSASHLEREDGPSIAIDYSDHQQTASFGSSREAKEYRAVQKELIDNGNFLGALQMDVDDLHDKFGDKYDKPISQLFEYYYKLEQAGKI